MRTVSGLIDEPATVTVNGVAATVDRTGWSADIPVWSGDNTVAVTATDNSPRALQISRANFV